MAQPRLKMRLGDLLVQEQIISDDQLQLALQQQRQTGRKLGTTLIDLGFISEVQLLQFLARQLDVPFFNLNNLTIDAAAVPLLPEVQARRYRALAVNLTDDKVTVAMSDPADLSALDAIAALLSPRIMVLAVAREGQLLEYFDRLYRRTREIESFAEQLQEEYQDSGFELGSSNLGANDEGEATVAKLLRSLFEDAVQVGRRISTSNRMKKCCVFANGSTASSTRTSSTRCASPRRWCCASSWWRGSISPRSACRRMAVST